MSVRVFYDVFCDGADCYVWVHTEGRNKPTARAEAKALGWGFPDIYTALCPTCANRLTDSAG